MVVTGEQGAGKAYLVDTLETIAKRQSTTVLFATKAMRHTKALLGKPILHRVRFNGRARGRGYARPWGWKADGRR